MTAATTGFEWAAKLNAENPPRPCRVPGCGSPRSGMQHLFEAHPDLHEKVRKLKPAETPDTAAPPRQRFGGVYIVTPQQVKDSSFDLEALASRTSELKLKTAVEATGATFDPKRVDRRITAYRRDEETGELVETGLLRGDATELHYRCTLEVEA